jgi:hypothetical protein
VNELAGADRELSTTRNSTIIIAGFWLMIVFQLTELRYIWGIVPLSRIANFVYLVIAILFVARTMASRFEPAVWHLYILPGLLVFAGMFVNFSVNAITDANALSYFGLILPWATFLAIPYLRKRGQIDAAVWWRWFYRFMVAAVALGLLDYVGVFYLGLPLKPVDTPNGPYLVGRFSLLFELANGLPHYRFYACIAEPGNLAMLLLPALAYAAWHKRVIGAAVMLVGLYLTASAGGFIGLTMLIGLILYLERRQRMAGLIAIGLALLAGWRFWPQISDATQYLFAQRTASREVRVEDFENVLRNLPAAIAEYPFGRQIGTLGSSNDQRLFFGTNFTVGTALYYGGALAMFGYVACLLVSLLRAIPVLWKVDPSVEEKIICTSILVLFPFIVQRTTVWDSSLFGFLFAPAILSGLERRATQPASSAVSFENGPGLNPAT